MDKMDFYTALSPTVLPLLKWYQAGHRDLPWRQNPTPYQVWISEIMLQQTRVQAVIPYYHRFLSLFPDVAALDVYKRQCQDGLLVSDTGFFPDLPFSNPKRRFLPWQI